LSLYGGYKNLTHLTWLAQELARLEQAIKQALDDDDDLHGKRDLLDSIPGLRERASRRCSPMASAMNGLTRHANSSPSPA
jgi:hypothetical protein